MSRIWGTFQLSINPLKHFLKKAIVCRSRLLESNFCFENEISAQAVHQILWSKL